MNPNLETRQGARPLPYHEYRERWFTSEWFWHQSNTYPPMLQGIIPKEDAEEMIRQRGESILPHVRIDTQTNRGRLFEFLADLTDEDGALAEFEDIVHLADWIAPDWLVPEPVDIPEITPPTGENLLDQESREKLPLLYSGEEKGLDTLAQVKFFTPDSSWTW